MNTNFKFLKSIDATQKICNELLDKVPNIRKHRKREIQPNRKQTTPSIVFTCLALKPSSK